MIFEINPYISSGIIEFGMSRSEVRLLLKEQPDSFYKGDDTTKTDYFVSLGVFVFYNEGDNCEAVELQAPAEPIFRGKNLLKMTLLEAIFFLKDDTSIETDESGYTSLLHGIGAYYEDAEDNQATTAISFVRRYYESS